MASSTPSLISTSAAVLDVTPNLQAVLTACLALPSGRRETFSVDFDAATVGVTRAYSAVDANPEAGRQTRQAMENMRNEQRLLATLDEEAQNEFGERKEGRMQRAYGLAVLTRSARDWRRRALLRLQPDIPLPPLSRSLVYRGHPPLTLLAQKYPKYAQQDFLILAKKPNSLPFTLRGIMCTGTQFHPCSLPPRVSQVMVQTDNDEWIYCGRYRAAPSATYGLTVEEWTELSDETKSTCCNLVSRNEGHHRVAQVWSEYDLGKRHILCHFLIPQAFDAELEKALYTLSVTPTPAAPVLAPHPQRQPLAPQVANPHVIRTPAPTPQLESVVHDSKPPARPRAKNQRAKPQARQTDAPATRHRQLHSTRPGHSIPQAGRPVVLPALPLIVPRPMSIRPSSSVVPSCRQPGPLPLPLQQQQTSRLRFESRPGSDVPIPPRQFTSSFPVSRSKRSRTENWPEEEYFQPPKRRWLKDYYLEI